MIKPPAFREGQTVIHADTCTDLREAASRQSIELHAFARGQYPGHPLPEDRLPGLRTVGYWNAVDSQSWGLDWHRNEGIEVTFLQSGQIDFWTTSSLWTLRAGDLTACGPWQLHRLGNPNIESNTLLWFIIDSNIRNKDQKCRWPNWIVLDPKDIEELIPRLMYAPAPVFHLSPKLRKTWESLHRELRDSGEVCPVSSLAIHINAILYDLLQLLRSTTPLENPGSADSTPALRMVQGFLDGLAAIPSQLEHPWTVKEMARVCHISATRFTQCCYQLTNLSPNHALNRMRIKYAEERIRNQPSIPIIKLALESGFSTSQYFATVFRKWTGMTPSEYRGQIVEQKED